MLTSFMDRVFYADLNGGGSRFRLKPAAAVISARRAGTTACCDEDGIADAEGAGVGVYEFYKVICLYYYKAGFWAEK